MYEIDMHLKSYNDFLNEQNANEGLRTGIATAFASLLLSFGALGQDFTDLSSPMNPMNPMNPISPLNPINMDDDSEGSTPMFDALSDIYDEIRGLSRNVSDPKLDSIMVKMEDLDLDEATDTVQEKKLAKSVLTEVYDILKDYGYWTDSVETAYQNAKNDDYEALIDDYRVLYEEYKKLTTSYDISWWDKVSNAERAVILVFIAIFVFMIGALVWMFLND